MQTDTQLPYAAAAAAAAAMLCRRDDPGSKLLSLQLRTASILGMRIHKVTDISDYFYCAAVLLGRNIRVSLVRLLVRLSVVYGFITRKPKSFGEPKVV